MEDIYNHVTDVFDVSRDSSSPYGLLFGYNTLNQACREPQQGPGTGLPLTFYSRAYVRPWC